MSLVNTLFNAVPRYGNYGGPNWGGNYIKIQPGEPGYDPEATDFYKKYTWKDNGLPIDRQDGFYEEHDKGYSKVEKRLELGEITAEQANYEKMKIDLTLLKNLALDDPYDDPDVAKNGNIEEALKYENAAGILFTQIAMFRAAELLPGTLSREVGNLLNELMNISSVTRFVTSVVISTFFNSASVWFRRADPLTLDLDGDGIETRALVNPDTLTSTSGTSPVYFDYDGNGTRVNTAWISPDDGLLVFDRNGNGIIDDASELFSDYTLLESGYKAANGYAALKQEDTNYDGVVNNLDANWNNLRIWKDLNTDGISQSDELLTMEQAGITGLNTNATNNQYTFTKSDGTTNTMADVNLDVDTFRQQFTSAIAVSPDVEALPDMQGSGLVIKFKAKFKYRNTNHQASQNENLRRWA